MSAEPEVVFNTATDPARVSGWLPAPLHRPPAATEPGHSASWRDDAGVWRADLLVEDTPVGGAVAVLEMTADGLDEGGLTAVVEQALFELDREVADNLTAG
ncbi:hypothetical protein O7635_17770 [Asanoa sp. WMMD1127]|uniref:hypothetical protein n=1 Tax=Asanoa sp. WMMD1127 TaxID=3016107 RepID=UPI002416A45E|nr:hypothetical protein [Asanoa sp. WMMD1127]MDG4823707.1 hypothetical protein [Asanoa sp. WMMD1127]